MKRTYFLLPTIISCLFIISCEQASDLPQKAYPNIIYILADDMGYGDVSALNENAQFTTPNLDQMAEKGMYFTDAHSNSAVCTPTRYGVLTGRYAWRTSMKSGVAWSWSEPLIASERTTVADILKRKGYQTACVGKWHLGLGWQKGENDQVDIRKPLTAGPNDLGFDYFFGITASLDIPPYIYIENNQSTTQIIDTIEKRDGKEFWRTGAIGDDFTHIGVLPKLTEKAVGFIDQQAKTDDPFFLYFPLPAPHTPILPTEEFQGKSQTNEYGDFVLMVDDVVGKVMEALDRNQMTENTLIVFTSDNGCSPMADFEELASFGHDPSYVFRGHKADIFEGGHRVPFLVQWPEKIKAGSSSDQTICLTDFTRTAASIVGEKIEDHIAEDSYDILPILLGKDNDQPIREATVHHSINGSFSIRQGKWKAVFCPGSGGWSAPIPKTAREQELPSVQLFDISEDIAEESNLADQHPEVLAKMKALMEKYIAEGRSTPGVPQNNDTPTFLNYPDNPSN